MTNSLTTATLALAPPSPITEWHAHLDLQVRSGQMAKDTATTYRQGMRKLTEWASQQERMNIAEKMIEPYYNEDGITIYNADCRDVLPQIERVDLVLVTDPPYEIKTKFGSSDLYGKRTMQFDFDIAGVTEKVVLPAFELALPKCQSFHTFLEPEQYAPIAAIARRLGFTMKPFAKIKACPPPPMPGNWWPSGFELAAYGYKPGAFFGDTSGKRVNCVTYDSYRHGIRQDEKANHPTQKWLPMIAYLLRCLIPSDGIVVDPFMGSGTTLRAAKDLGLKAIGIEIERKYCDIAIERLRQQAFDFE